MPVDRDFAPNDWPDVEVEVDGVWLPGELRSWIAKDDEQWASVQWHPGDGSTRLEVVHGDRVRKAGLTDEHRAILDFETTNQHWKYAGAREAAIVEQLGISVVRYSMQLQWLLDQPAALEYAPVTVRRLSRLRDARAAVR